MPTERDEQIELDVFDYETALAILADIHGREAWSTPAVLAHWVATIRAAERADCMLSG